MDLTDARIRAITADPAQATAAEIRALCDEVGRWRPVHGFLLESLKAIFINAKEAAEQTLVTQVLRDIARTCMRRMHEASASRLPTGPTDPDL